MKLLLAETERFDQQVLALLERNFDVDTGPLDRAQLLRRVRDVEVLWTRLHHRIDEDVLLAAPRLRAIVTPTTGLNHIDLEGAAVRGIQVLSLRGETEFLKRIRATAEHTLGLLLALVRRVPGALAHVQEGGWNRDLFRGSELYGKTAGVVGYGRLGAIVARMLAAFEMEVLVADPHRRPADVSDGARLVTLPTLLESSDVVTVHASLEPTTYGLIGAREIGMMRPGAWLINTARGELVDENALVAALTSGKLAGAAVDVVVDEHGPSRLASPLFAHAKTHANLIITPHIGGCTDETMVRTERFMADKLLQWAASRTGVRRAPGAHVNTVFRS